MLLKFSLYRMKKFTLSYKCFSTLQDFLDSVHRVYTGMEKIRVTKTKVRFESHHCSVQ
jgi:hypothetical protein